ncbi:MAG: hypothetical protein R3330_00535, partial [Saprospiraceae bacterium]|nr:hypothetical protein [Saprospiraceae bacterium]
MRTFTDTCGNTITETQQITVDPAPPAVFASSPADTTMSCADASNYVPPSLSYNNGVSGSCAISGTVPGNMTGGFDPCGNSTLQVEWSFTDSCGRTITEVQVISVDPAPPVTFQNVPADVTLNCGQANNYTPDDLIVTNGASGACLVIDTVPGVIDGVYDACGGSLLAVWTYTDPCGNEIQTQQVITVANADPPTVQSVPADITLTCEEAETYPAGALIFTNNQNGACNITDTIPGVFSGSISPCGGTLTVTWTYVDSCGNSVMEDQLITVQATPPPTFQNVPGDITLTCDEAIAYSPQPLVITNGLNSICNVTDTVAGSLSGSFDACGGTLVVTWSYSDSCGNTETAMQNIIVNPAPAPAFTGVPADTTFSCADAGSLVASSLTYTNGLGGACALDGSVPGVISGTYDACGGTLTQTWAFTDSCGNTINATQQITVEPAPAPVFVNVPGDTTLTCAEAASLIATDLSYTNSESGACAVNGTVSGVLSGSFDICGGTLTQTWSLTDSCGNTLIETQQITVEPAPAASFINIPADTTVSCADAGSLVAANLAFTNGESGSCAITGDVPGVITGAYDACGGAMTQTWSFTDSCGNVITASQQITVTPAPAPVFVNVPADTALSCDDATALAATDLTYSNGESGQCAINGTVPGVITGTVDACGGQLTQTWTYTDSCGNTITDIQTITVDPAPAPAFVNVPADLTLDCSDAQALTPSDLTYSNGVTGVCAIDGTVAGVITGSFDVCGGTLTQTWSFTDTCGNTIMETQQITVNPTPAPTFINVPADTTLTCDEAALLAAMNLSYTNGESGNCEISGNVPGVIMGSFDACGGLLTQTWSFTDTCGNMISESQSITVLPAPAPVFPSVPADTTISCADATTLASEDLAYTNGVSGPCAIAGTVAGVVSGSFDECGGALTQSWSFTDSCGNTIMATQQITVEPAPAPDFVDVPADTTLTCAQAALFGPSDLTYTNNESGVCAVTGTVTGSIAGNYDVCGGTLTQTWNFTDSCGNTITEIQTITVEPAPAPDFVNVPADTVLSCDEAVLFAASDLAFTNGATGDCEISGMVPGTISGSFDACGGVLTQTWSLTDSCGTVITETQTITVEPAPAPIFIAVPADTTVTCADAPGFVSMDLAYTNGETGSCEVSGTVPGNLTGSYDLCGGTLMQTWTLTDSCGNTITETQTITVEPAPAPVFDMVSDTMISCDDAPSFVPADLAYSNGLTGSCEVSGVVSGVLTGTLDPCAASSLQVQWTFTDSCGNMITAVQNVIVEQAPLAQFEPVADTTLTCDEAVALVPSDLAFSNGASGVCAIDGVVPGTISGTYDACGGTLTQTWSYTDSCGNTITAVQNITVLPAPAPAFANAPPDTTISCDEAESLVAMDLSYTNGAGGACAIAGTVPGVITGTYDACGGTLVQSWSFTDSCGNTITESQTLTVTPAPPVAFINAPPDTTLTCEDAASLAATNLDYSNGALGACGINGSVPGVINGTFDACGGVLTQTWTFTDTCGNTITESQQITVMPAPSPVFNNVPADITLSCDEATSFSPGDLSYANGATGTCEISGTVPGAITGTFDACGGTLSQTWTFTDSCGN